MWTTMNNYVKLSLLVLLVSISGCTKLDPLCSQTEDERLATLNSLKQINDYPFYTMIYYSDYGLKDYLNNKTTPLPANNITSKDGYMCTCFTAKGTDTNQLLGRNFDWHAHLALLLFTHPNDGYASMSMVHLPGLGYSGNYPLNAEENREALLSSPYWPVDGINECGLAVGGMAVDKVEPPYNPNKKTLNRMVIMRLVLDYAKNLDEAIHLLNSFNFDFPNDPLHFIICDASGNSAVIEFLESELKVIRNKEPWQVSTNTNLYGTKMPDAANFSVTNADTWSKWRYAKVYETLKKSNGITTINGALNILNSVSLASSSSSDVTTMWSAIYNLTSREMDIVTNRKFSEVHHFSLNNFRKVPMRLQPCREN
jgi:hypothetical protein